MKFTVRRTSLQEPAFIIMGEEDYNEAKRRPPCEGAIWSLPPWPGTPLLLEDRPVWTLEIGSLEELLALERREGPLVVRKTKEGHEIEIYDGYRE